MITSIASITEASFKIALTSACIGKLIAGSTIFSIVWIPQNASFIACGVAGIVPVAALLITKEVADRRLPGYKSLALQLTSASLSIKVVSWLTGLTFKSAAALTLLGSVAWLALAVLGVTLFFFGAGAAIFGFCSFPYISFQTISDYCNNKERLEEVGKKLKSYVEEAKANAEEAKAAADKKVLELKQYLGFV